MKILHDKEAHQINYLDERFYTNDGETFYPSVTTVLEVYPKGYFFNQWLKDLGMNADEVLRRAGEVGSNVHEGIESYLKGNELKWMLDNGEQNFTFEEWLMILKFVEFWQTYKPELLSTEKNLISENLKLGGTLDITCIINGEKWLIDAKTSNYIWKTHELQLAAYAMMENEKEDRVDRVGIMHLKALTRGPDKAGKKIQGKGWQLKEFNRHYTEAWKIFEHTYKIWQEENPVYKPKNMIYADRVSMNYEIELFKN